MERFTYLLDFGIGLLPFYYSYYVWWQIKVELSFGNTKGDLFQFKVFWSSASEFRNNWDVNIMARGLYCKHFPDVVGLLAWVHSRERKGKARYTRRNDSSAFIGISVEQLNDYFREKQSCSFNDFIIELNFLY